MLVAAGPRDLSMSMSPVAVQGFNDYDASIVEGSIGYSWWSGFQLRDIAQTAELA